MQAVIDAYLITIIRSHLHSRQIQERRIRYCKRSFLCFYGKLRQDISLRVTNPRTSYRFKHTLAGNITVVCKGGYAHILPGFCSTVIVCQSYRPPLHRQFRGACIFLQKSYGCPFCLGIYRFYADRSASPDRQFTHSHIISTITLHCQDIGRSAAFQVQRIIKIKIPGQFRPQVSRPSQGKITVYGAIQQTCPQYAEIQGTSFHDRVTGGNKTTRISCNIRPCGYGQGIPGIGIRLVDQKISVYTYTVGIFSLHRNLVVLGQQQCKIAHRFDTAAIIALQRQCTGSRLVTPAVALCILCDIHGYCAAFCVLRDVKRCQGFLRSYRRYLLCRLLNDIPLGNTFRCGCGFRCRRCCRFGFRCCRFGFRCCRFGSRCCRFGFR